MMDTKVIVHAPNRIRPEWMAFDPFNFEWAVGDTEDAAKDALRAVLLSKEIATEKWPNFTTDEDSGKRHLLQELHNERRLNEQWRTRAEAAEARINTLKEQLEICNRALRNTQDSCIAAGDRAYAAEAEVQRLRTALATAKAEGANEERSLHWMQADAEVQRLRALWQRAIDADLLDDPHELEAAIVEASKLLNYPRTLPEDD